uniref:Reverse transcriptase domain-containing protein n=1 Tax=Heterorhabditis bacteriophora TaxID=37862 RepID=A0A1I7X7C9_HETBA
MAHQGPQFSSEIARQIVADLDKEKMRSTSKQLFMVPSATQQNLALLMDSNSTKSVYISKLNRTVQRYDDEKSADEHSTFHSQNMTSASSYHGPQRPKFTSSVGQMYNKD